MPYFTRPSTTGLITNGKYTSDASGTLIETNGFTTAGDGGGAQWKKTGNTITASQTPALTGDATCSDSAGNEFRIVGNAIFAEQVGGVLDGVVDNTNITTAVLAWAATTGGNFYIGKGVYLSGNTALASKTLSVTGLGAEVSEWKLKNNENSNVFSLTGTGRLSAKNISINQNRANQTAGHGIRLGGCDELTLSNVIIYNCVNYGIGAQAGTNKNTSVDNLTVHTVGRDGIDIKDYNSDNDVFIINGYRCYDYALDTDQQVALDVRGGVQASNLSISTQGSNYGVRYRAGGVQGRAGFGSMKGLIVTSSDNHANSIAIDAEGDSANWSVSGVSVVGCGIAVRQGTGGVGGVITNLTATGLVGADCLRFSGSDLILSNISCKNTAASSRIVDFEASANNIQINNFLLEDNSGNASAIRIQAGAQDVALSSGVVRNGAVTDSGTATVQSNVRVL